MKSNSIIDKLPNHLKPTIVDQRYESYTAQDQAVWRTIMKQNTHYLKNIAHSSYIEGLVKTGISVDRIPSIEEMNQSLKKIGWAAVAVDGFIPPSAFMEFQKHRVLVIAADIRPVNQIAYTPAPDIIHEAAGHAPIIADPEYSEYLRYFGEIGSKAFSSKSDYRIYEAIRHLSILKADPTTTGGEIKAAEKLLNNEIIVASSPSEMSLIRNLHWWTVEYGLVGSINNPKIYGAGLLSSIGESKSALKPDVTKIQYSIDAKDFSFDITAPQPQLFVASDFQHLTRVLDEFANKMALRTGGLEGILKAIESGETATIEYSSGLQVSGTFTDVIIHKGGSVYIMTTGPTTLNYKNKLLPGEDGKKHPHGFGSPIGKIKGTLAPTRFLSDNDLKKLGIKKGIYTKFEFESGIKIEGELLRVIRKNNNLILMSFINCTVKYDGRILFEPEWGQYDMAIGENIVSAYSGPADADGFGLKYETPKEGTHQLVYDQKTINLHKLYEIVEAIRQKEKPVDSISVIWDELIDSYPNEWLLQTEIYELIKSNYNFNSLSNDIKNFLIEKRISNPDTAPIINSIIDR